MNVIEDKGTTFPYVTAHDEPLGLKYVPPCGSPFTTLFGYAKNHWVADY